ncbi:uncharacterized protein LAJ45_10363 [Morchella importuna]|uniref:uncharacterized protein n=1 Tax=Morchella importuna TaxID=1174673 RepID=UPI001E8EE09E|nr:uncharacterized protein LAJ45_10363 [Morchella importuna]KAH8145563.1 hypothetical protein LAJ45_10363 [Morchella importuna]
MYRVGALGRQAGGKDLCLGWKSGRVVGGDDVTEVVGERTKSSGRVSGRAIEQVDSHSHLFYISAWRLSPVHTSSLIPAPQ